jgi:hypothetical protein
VQPELARVDAGKEIPPQEKDQSARSQAECQEDGNEGPTMVHDSFHSVAIRLPQSFEPMFEAGLQPAEYIRLPLC